MCCTDSVSIGGEVLAEGDYAGPMGARMVLRDPGWSWRFWKRREAGFCAGASP